MKQHTRRLDGLLLPPPGRMRSLEPSSFRAFDHPSKPKQRVLRERQVCRAGLAAVEFALCLPLLMVLILGSIEASNAIFLRQAMTIAAYETAQIASAFGGTEQGAKLRGEEILKNYNINKYSVTIVPAITAETIPGSKIEVTVTAPANSNSIGPPWFFKDATYRRVFTMYRL